MAKTTDTKVIKIGEREFEIISENRFRARVFEAVAARSSIIMDALDQARAASFAKEEGKKERPKYKHTILLGKDDEGHNLRANIAVFPNSVVIQTLKEK